MKAIERISEIQKRNDPRPIGTWKDPVELERFSKSAEDREFLLKAFKVMREIAIDQYEKANPLKPPFDSLAFKKVSYTPEEWVLYFFENRMSEPIKTGPSEDDFKNNRW